MYKRQEERGVNRQLSIKRFSVNRNPQFLATRNAPFSFSVESLFDFADYTANLLAVHWAV